MCVAVAMMMRRKTAFLMQRRWERKQKHHSSLLHVVLLIALSSSLHYTTAVFAFTRTVSLFLLPQNHQHVGENDHSPPTTKKEYSVHLLSLKKSDRKKQVRQVWKWKDTVLGDGRDFFVPKPKTLTALNRYIVNKVEGVHECSAVSNCARFELLLLVDDTKKSESQRQDFTSIEQAVSQCLLAQVESHASKQGIVNLLFNFDNPMEIDPLAYSNIDIDLEWTHLVGVEWVTRHLSVVAAGMAERPNRPGRPVPFRPFSSRDAHILLQLKRTSEVARGSPTVKAILDAALTAGKAARDPNQVPELEPLRRYGSESSRYSSEAPTYLSEAAAKAAMELAIEPAVEHCVANYQAREQADAIVQLREQAERMAETPEEVRWLNQQLHQPTMNLRKGIEVDKRDLLVTLESELQAMRSKTMESTRLK